MTANCPSCGTAFSDRFCGHCGEKRLSRNDLRVPHFLRSAALEAADLRGRMWATLISLVVRPGELTNNFMQGRRVNFWHPVRLFIIANLVYFFVQPYTGYNVYNTTLHSQQHRQQYSDVLPVEEWLTTKQAALGHEDQTFELIYNQQSNLLARSLLVLMIPLFGLMLWLLFLFRPEPLLRHLVFSLHLQSFTLLFVVCVFLTSWSFLVNLLFNAAAWLNGLPVGEYVAQLPDNFRSTFGFINESIVAPVFAYWLYLGFRRAYRIRPMAAAGATLASMAVMIASITAYRLILLFATLATL